MLEGAAHGAETRADNPRERDQNRSAMGALGYDALLATANALARDQRWEDALRVLDEHPALVEGSFDLSWNAGWWEYKLERFEEALVPLRRAIALAPDKPLGHWALGVVLAELGKMDEAAAEYREALRLRDSFLARRSLGLVLMDLGRLDEAEAVFREGLALQPHHRERVVGLADFLFDIGRKDEAEVLYRHAERLPTREERGKTPRPR